MASIESSPYPLAFRVGNANELQFVAPDLGEISIRTKARALEGMQKEAVVSYGPTETSWRMVCDEGPYLNGTDLAPFPLAFFTAGLVASYMSEIIALLGKQGIVYRDIKLIQENRYSMEGSALKGTMTGSALPVDLKVRLETDADKAAIADIIKTAVRSSPAGALLRSELESEFNLTLNGEQIETGRVAQMNAPAEPAPEGFDTAVPTNAEVLPSDIITKLESAETVQGVAGGAGTSLAADQKRTLHVTGLCTLRRDGVKMIRTQLSSPIGSVFRFLSDDSRHLEGLERAPSGLVLLSAGIAFCYLTQLGRYAHIVKKPLAGYSLIQDTHFSLPEVSGRTGAAPVAAPLKTQVYIDGPDVDADYARTLVDMGEQTCFLHAACRSAVETRIVD